MRKEALSTVYELAKANPKVLFIGSDLSEGTLVMMKEELPKQFLMEGISEQHLVGFAAGLAKEGYIPFLNTIANFLTRRALEQIILDVCLHKLPVKFLASGGGMVYAPLGPTHTAVDDFAHMLAIPDINVYAPCDALEMTNILMAEVSNPYPAYIRFGKGDEEIVSNKMQDSDDKLFKFFGDKYSERLIVSTGVCLQPTLESLKFIPKNNVPLVVHIAKLNSLSPNLIEMFRHKKRVLVVEEHQEQGGLFTKLLHLYCSYGLDASILRSISLGFGFIRKYGSQIDHFKDKGITPENISRELLK